MIVIIVKSKSPTLVRCASREAWWELSLQRYAYFLKLQTFCE